MSKPLERCFVCGAPTGRAGATEDSLYTTHGVGPFCEACWDDREMKLAKPVPDPRVTALVTAAKGIDAFAEHRITCSMRRIQTQHIPCSCGLSPARKDLTAALEAFPND